MKTASIVLLISFCASACYGLSCYSCWGSSCERSSNQQPEIKECVNQTSSVVYNECISATMNGNYTKFSIIVKLFLIRLCFLVGGSETKMKGCVPYVWIPLTDSISCDFIKSVFDGVTHCYTCTSDRCNVDDLGNSV